MNRKAFTLIELIVVIILISIILIVTLPNVLKSIEVNKKEQFIDDALYMIEKTKKLVSENPAFLPIMSNEKSAIFNLNFIDKNYEIVNSKYDMPYNRSYSYVKVTKNDDGSYTYSVTLLACNYEEKNYLAVAEEDNDKNNFIENFNLQNFIPSYNLNEESDDSNVLNRIINKVFIAKYKKIPGLFVIADTNQDGYINSSDTISDENLTEENLNSKLGTVQVPTGKNYYLIYNKQVNDLKSKDLSIFTEKNTDISIKSSTNITNFLLDKVNNTTYYGYKYFGETGLNYQTLLNLYYLY